MSSMFPTVNFLINLSSVGVLWIGANRVADGDIQVGSLVAYLSYLVQILMSVVMATFTVSMIPRAAVSAGRIQEVLDTEPTVVPPARRPSTTLSSHRRARVPRRRLPLPRRRAPGADRHLLHDGGRAHDGDHRQHGVGQDHARQPHPPAVRQHVRNRAGRRRRRPRPRPGVAVEQHRARPQKPYLFSGTVASNLRYGKPDATEAEMWEALEVAQAADFVRAMPGGLEAASSRAAPTCPVGSASAWRSPGR